MISSTIKPIKKIENSTAQDENLFQELRVAFVLLENFSMASFTSAVDALVTAQLVSPSIQIEKIMYGNQIDSTRVMSDIGIEVVVESFPCLSITHSLDMVIICGGYRTSLSPNSGIQALIKLAVKENMWLGGLWNGSYYIAKEGLLRGTEVSIHPESLALLTENCPTTHPSDKAYVIHERIFSSAGPSSAMQMMIEVCGHIFGQTIKRSVEVILACDVPVSDGANLVRHGKESQLPYNLRLAVELMRNNIEEPLSLEDIAQYANLSRRQLERYFERHLNVSPSKYYIELRLEQAKRLLLQTNMPVIQIAVACGFISPTHFSRAFRKKFGLSPKKIRFSIRS
ncbi:GlxA family transcriptional regulator [Nitrincola nitratireducens]|uniref:L-rhamnose operon regulatory protein rhaS n=1 Tax=Nitrincola nitratireducens TaxID=1229521 RepID=W9V8U9_9GAMM|nr:helix-turn-helix domain-containing protein [Nitrincola nitratireducens]EXJ12492.1 L-rhamnose operon regulatory protein rhaS [Nitrincola nitratireducens]